MKAVEEKLSSRLPSFGGVNLYLREESILVGKLLASQPLSGPRVGIWDLRAPKRMYLRGLSDVFLLGAACEERGSPQGPSGSSSSQYTDTGTCFVERSCFLALASQGGPSTSCPLPTAEEWRFSTGVPRS